MYDNIYFLNRKWCLVCKYDVIESWVDSCNDYWSLLAIFKGYKVYGGSSQLLLHSTISGLTKVRGLDMFSSGCRVT